MLQLHPTPHFIQTYSHIYTVQYIVHHHVIRISCDREILPSYDHDIALILIFRPNLFFFSQAIAQINLDFYILSTFQLVSLEPQHSITFEDGENVLNIRP